LPLKLTTAHSDQYLILGLIENNSAIINEIYKKYSPKIYNWIKQNSGDAEQAQDIFQEAIIDVFKKAKDQGFVLTCPFDAFIFVIVRNKWFSFLKNNKLKVVTNNEDALYNITDSVQQDANKIMQYEKQHKLLMQKLDELQEGCKELLKLSWGGLCMEDVAEKLKVTYAYVRKKKSLCMAKLIDSVKSSEQFHQLSFIN
jgi:RNA polymerase sigma factor (sigma-70 family)